ncbi:MAG: S-adenosylmethionine:tRNA ribosyltransferase-isomerase [Bacteroidales bacterium]|nr:S-adenosylmethionine:tRNA ribosyltransferase-isomerase [Bacteroidales bacterium]
MKVYDYPLPDDRIAKYPLPKRDDSKLLVYDHGKISDAHFRDVVSFLPEGSLLVRNDTKVIRARLRFHKATGAAIEIFCLEPTLPAEVEQAFTARGESQWKCIVGNSKRWKEGTLTAEVETSNGPVSLSATRLSQDGNTSEILFQWPETATFAEVIEAAGVMPIPPYLNRETEPIDETRYQTVYSEHKGSVAAPTAGLHFTPEVLADVQSHGHEILSLTLHVGAGTFKPVQTEEVEDHVMHTEHIVVTRHVVERLASKKGKTVAVGTTSVRTLESLYWLGVKLLAGQDITDGLGQWEAYTLPSDTPAPDALYAILRHLDATQSDELHSQTQIMIKPGYKYHMVDALITNFHQPHSTLLLLIGAFVGDDWQRIYAHALANDYRFLSYGDSSLLMP